MVKVASEDLILTHDLGTSQDKGALVTTRGRVVASARESYPVSHPKPNWAEQDPEDWWGAVVETTRRVLEETGTTPERVKAVVFSCQMLGVIPVDGGGEPLRPAIIWLDSRAGESAKGFVQHGWPHIKLHGVKVSVRALVRWLRITGGGPSPVGKDPIWKVLWLRENEPDVWRETRKVLDVKDYLVHRCTGKFAMSRDSANLTWLFDTRPGHFKWHPKLLGQFNLTADLFPEVVPSTEVVGPLTERAAAELGLTTSTKVVCGSGDVAAATVGAGTVRENATHIYIGTSGWIVAPVTRRVLHIGSFTGSICHADPTKYIFVAEKETAGACVEWFLRTLGQQEAEEAERRGVSPYDVLEEEARAAEPGSNNLMFFPWLFGERAPVDDDTVRGAFFNLSLDHDREHFARALFEGVALNFRFALKGFTARKVLGPGDPVNVIGGGALSDTWCQIIADATNHPVQRVEDPQQAGARGAALIAAVGLGYYRDFESLEPLFRVERRFTPDPGTRRVYDFLFQKFVEFYRANKTLFRDLNWFRTRWE
ncbi:MAG: xylulokinase [Promethearchaeota archaeon]